MCACMQVTSDGSGLGAAWHLEQVTIVDTNRGVFIEGATEHVARQDSDVLRLLEAGSRARHVSATGMNEESSRSHAIFTITVQAR